MSILVTSNSIGLGLSSLSKPDIPLLLLSSSASEKNTARVGERKHNRPFGHKDIILSTCQKPHVKKQEVWKTYLFWLVLPTPADGILHKSWKNKRNADTSDCRYINELTALKRTSTSRRNSLRATEIWTMPISLAFFLSSLPCTMIAKWFHLPPFHFKSCWFLFQVV